MRRASLAGILFALAAGISAAEGDHTKRLEDLEKRLESDLEAVRKELGKEPAPKESAAGGALRRIAERTKLGGYFDLEFDDFRHKTGSFDNHHLILNVSTWLHDRIFFNSELEYEHAGSEFRVEQGYVDFMIHDAINFRGGVFLQPVGRLNLLHDSDLRDLTLRPLTTTDIIPTTWSDIGVGLHGSFFIGPVTLNYETYVANGLKDEEFTVSEGLHDAGENLGRDNNNDKAVSARLEAVALDGHLVIGAAAYEGKFDPEDRHTLWLYGADATLSIPLAEPGGWISGPLEFRAEAAKFQTHSGVNAAGDPVPRRGYGAFLQVSFHFYPTFLKPTFLGKGFENPTFTLVALADAVVIDVPGADHDNHQRRLSLGLNYRPIEQVAFKVETVYEASDEIFGNTRQVGFVASIAAGF